MVKVGNSECGLRKLTPWSRSAAMVGAVSGVTVKAPQAVGDEQNQVARLWPFAGATAEAASTESEARE